MSGENSSDCSWGRSGREGLTEAEAQAFSPSHASLLSLLLNDKAQDVSHLFEEPSGPPVGKLTRTAKASLKDCPSKMEFLSTRSASSKLRQQEIKVDLHSALAENGG
jgi:hypothetical protein